MLKKKYDKEGRGVKNRRILYDNMRTLPLTKMRELYLTLDSA